LTNNLDPDGLFGQGLRITVNDSDGCTGFGVEGALTSPAAEELRKCWKQVSIATPYPERLSVDLTSMTDIDSAGKELLMDMYRTGVKLVGSGIMTRAVIEEIMGRR